MGVSEGFISILSIAVQSSSNDQGQRHIFRAKGPGASGHRLRGGRSWERVSPFPPGVGPGDGAMLPPHKMFGFLHLKCWILARSERFHWRHPPTEDFAILRQEQQTPFRGQEAQYTNRKYCSNTNAIRNWTLVTSSYRVTVRTSVQSW